MFTSLILSLALVIYTCIIWLLWKINSIQFNFCLPQFHTEALTALLADDNKFGFIVMDGNGALFGTLQGNTREVLHKFTVDLPKKHGRKHFLWVWLWYSRLNQIFFFLQVNSKNNNMPPVWLKPGTDSNPSGHNWRLQILWLIQA